MPRCSAERQAAYRERHLKDPEGGLERLNLLVSLQAKRQLERLAASYGVTQKSLLEQPLAEAERAVLAQLSANAQDDDYEQRPTALRRNGSDQASG